MKEPFDLPQNCCSSSSWSSSVQDNSSYSHGYSNSSYACSNNNDEVMDTEEPDMPDTQQADSQCFTQSQDTAEIDSESDIWGRLWPMDTFPLFELKNDEFTFGRFKECDISVTDANVSRRRELLISKIHFKILREKCVSSLGIVDDVVYLKDESQNGTYVNDKLVGKGKTVVLVNNDLIAIIKNTFKVYVYMSIKGYDDSTLPDNLKTKYAVSRSLGAGACGEVKMCFSKCGVNAGKKFAIKIISKVKMTKSNFNDEKHIMNEVEICSKLKHPCIIKIIEYFDSPSMLYIILELMEGGELFERIISKGGLSEKNAKFLFYQIVLAVNYLHENDVTHRDLKPENILLANDSDETLVKVSDFGLSKFVDSQTMLKSLCGTPMYVAPEILKSGSKQTSYSSKVDVWSLGVILYCSLSGLTPFRVNDKKISLYEQIRKGMFNFNNSKFFNISYDAKDLIKKMMTVDPVNRISIEKVLQHPWMNDFEVLTKVNKLLGISNLENISPVSENDNIKNNLVR